MTWDSISTIDWSTAHQPQPYALSVSTTGCGCCAESDIICDTKKAIEAVQDYIAERENELKELREWLAHMGSSNAIIPIGKP